MVILPPKAKEILDSFIGGSYESYAASFEVVLMVLSGMSTMEQMEDNITLHERF